MEVQQAAADAEALAQMTPQELERQARMTAQSQVHVFSTAGMLHITSRLPACEYSSVCVASAQEQLLCGQPANLMPSG